MMRLEISEKNLAEKMKVVSEEKRKSAVRVACELAFQICPVDLPVVDESLSNYYQDISYRSSRYQNWNGWPHS